MMKYNDPISYLTDEEKRALGRLDPCWSLHMNFLRLIAHLAIRVYKLEGNDVPTDNP